MIRAWIVALPLAFFTVACASSPEPPPPPEPVVEAPKPPPPPPPVREPEPVPVAQRVLPKTASPIPAIGLAGVGALLGAGALRQIRRKLLG